MTTIIMSEDKDTMYKDGKSLSTMQSIWEFKHKNYDISQPMINMPTLWFDIDSFMDMHPTVTLKSLGGSCFSVKVDNEHVGYLIERHIYKCTSDKIEEKSND